MSISLQVNIPAKQSYSYPITIKSGLLNEWQDWLPSYAQSRKVVIISDSTVAQLYAEDFCTQLIAAGYSAKLFDFPAGEHSKSVATKLRLEEQMFEFGCDRHTLCIAFGGGVVGDLAGFVAATFMRGMNFIQIPTSLLAMIDSSVGGKTAVNTSYGKNIIGAFWQPQAVFMDIALLHTLPQEHIVNGFFEAVKVFLTLDRESFEFCQQNIDKILQLDAEDLTPVIEKAVKLKAHVVEIDEYERNLRMILNYGHTVAHAIEKLSNYQVLHGYAVALGMLVEARIAQLCGLLNDENYQIVATFLQKLNITPLMLDGYNIDEIICAMRGDKKNTNQKIKLVLLTGIGQVKNEANQVAFDIDESIIANALTILMDK